LKEKTFCQRQFDDEIQIEWKHQSTKLQNNDFSFLLSHYFQSENIFNCFAFIIIIILIMIVIVVAVAVFFFVFLNKLNFN